MFNPPVKNLGQLIRKKAELKNINPRLLAAIISQESSGNPYAIRYESGFFVKYVKTVDAKKLLGYVPELCSLNTEKHARATSWGLMQIMGQTAREAGFRGEFLSELLDPTANLDTGTAFLSKLMERHSQINDVLLAYNGGGDKEYPDRIQKRMDSGEADRLLYW